MQNNYLEAKEIHEKQKTVERIIELTINGSIYWELSGSKYTAHYSNTLNNEIEFENYMSHGNSSICMSKMTICNENGKKIIYNGDITDDLHRRLINCIYNQTKETNILQDFL